MFAVSVSMVLSFLLAPDALGSSALLALLVRATRELVPLVVSASVTCGYLASLVLLVPAVGGSFMLVVRFQVFCPSHPETDSESSLPSCLRFLAGVRFMVNMILAVGIIVLLLLLCASVWFFVVVVGC